VEKPLIPRCPFCFEDYLLCGCEAGEWFLIRMCGAETLGLLLQRTFMQRAEQERQWDQILGAPGTIDDILRERKARR
jgi:hypothetical protein